MVKQKNQGKEGQGRGLIVLKIDLAVFYARMVRLGAPTPALSLAKCSAEKTKCIDLSQPPHQGDELKSDTKLTLPSGAPGLLQEGEGAPEQGP